MQTSSSDLTLDNISMLNVENVNEPSISVCILFFEKLDQTIECIKSFLDSNVAIYILNNGSSTSSRKNLEEFCKRYPQITIFDAYKNLGVGVGRNFIIEHTNEEWMLFIDNDILINTTDFLKRFIEHLRLYPETEVFIPQIYNVHTNRYNAKHSLKIVGNMLKRGSLDSNNATNTFPGGAALVHRNLFSRLGLYDINMFVGYEDLELCVRALREGDPVNARYIDDIELIHDHRYTDNKNDLNTIKVRYNLNILENSLKILMKRHNIMMINRLENWSKSQAENISKKPNIVSKMNSILHLKIRRITLNNKTLIILWRKLLSKNSGMIGKKIFMLKGS